MLDVRQLPRGQTAKNGVAILASTVRDKTERPTMDLSPCSSSIHLIHYCCCLLPCLLTGRRDRGLVGSRSGGLGTVELGSLLRSAYQYRMSKRTTHHCVREGPV